MKRRSGRFRDRRHIESAEDPAQGKILVSQKDRARIVEITADKARVLRQLDIPGSGAEIAASAVDWTNAASGKGKYLGSGQQHDPSGHRDRRDLLARDAEILQAFLDLGNGVEGRSWQPRPHGGGSLFRIDGDARILHP